MLSPIRAAAAPMKASASRRRMAVLSLTALALLLVIAHLSQAPALIGLALSTFPAPEAEPFCEHTVHQRELSNLLHPALRALRAQVAPARLLDVGAGVGNVSLPAMLCMASRHYVVSVEPVSANVAVLQTAARKFGVPISKDRRASWRLVRGALAEEDGPGTVYMPNTSHAAASLFQNASIALLQETNKTTIIAERTRLRNGDALLQKMQFTPDVIRIDVQGAEFRVVTGLEGVISANRDLVVVIAQNNRLMEASGYDVLAVHDFMTQRGFKTFCKPRLRMNNKRLTTKDREYSANDISWKDPEECASLTYLKHKV